MDYSSMGRDELIRRLQAADMDEAGAAVGEALSAYYKELRT